MRIAHHEPAWGELSQRGLELVCFFAGVARAAAGFADAAEEAGRSKFVT